MKEACDMLPESLDDLDLERTGYHRHFYQAFTMNLSQLISPSDNTSADPSTSLRHHSPRRKSAGALLMVLKFHQFL